MENEEKQGVEFEIVREIKRIREFKQISQKDFAEKLGEPLRTYVHFENNKNAKVSADLLFKATQLLEIDIVKFINPDKYKEPEDARIVVKESDIRDLVQSNKELTEQVRNLTSVITEMKERIDTMETFELFLQFAKQQKALNNGHNTTEVE